MLAVVYWRLVLIGDSWRVGFWACGLVIINVIDYWFKRERFVRSCRFNVCALCWDFCVVVVYCFWVLLSVSGIYWLGSLGFVVAAVCFVDLVGM